MFLDHLPGLVDGVSLSPGGESFWVSIITIPSRTALLLMRGGGGLSSRLLRWGVATLPGWLQPKVEPYGLVVQVRGKQESWDRKRGT